ncbi:phytolongin Phyl2.2-like [Chenopodium quinoa]|uniref:phytolongin Phyl2.2-like n=1 Tax=Chenopodium quinoa TaxID=63459 RepID=UPI000B799BDA|nr:phytolongin Phyl2.2-like [Chenopodium quinoa]
MISDPDLVRYACVAHHRSLDSSTILGEFNSADSALQQLAHQCLHSVPPHHSIFSHSYRNQAYTFLLNDGFVYFGIFDSKLRKSDQIQFLGCLKETFHHIINGKSDIKFSNFCLQGELHPIFHKLLSKSCDFDALQLIPNGVHNNNNSKPVSSKNKKILNVSLLSASKICKGVKKNKLFDERTNSGEPLVDDKVDLLNEGNFDVGDVKNREINTPNGNFLMGGGVGVGRNKAKKIWRRHVWIVLVLDLAVCLILFGIWLFVCRGFQCIEG